MHVFRVPALIVAEFTGISRELLEVPMKRPVASPDDQRKQGGCRQREEREYKAAKAELGQSATAHELVLKSTLKSVRSSLRLYRAEVL